MKNITEHIIKPGRYSCLCAVIFLGSVLSTSAPSLAQSVTYPSELNIPYGRSYRDENTPYNPSSRSANGNRLIINGRILSGDGTTLSGGLESGFLRNQSQYGGANAIGNQLNVVTNGSWNTVIIDNTQINNGNQTVNSNAVDDHQNPPVANGESYELNGRINLND